MGHQLQAGPTRSLKSLLNKKRAGALHLQSRSPSAPPSALPQSLTPVPKATSLGSPRTRPAALPAPSYLLQINSDPLAGSLTTAPAPWGLFGVVSAMEGTHARVWDAATRRRNKCQRGAPAPVTGFSAGATSQERPARTPTPSGETSSPQHRAVHCPGKTRSSRELPVRHHQEQSWVSRKTWAKAELPSKAQRGWPNAVGAGFCRDRKCSFHFREEEAVLKRGNRSGAPGHNGKCSFLVLAPPALHAYWPSKLKKKRPVKQFFSLLQLTDAPRPLPFPDHEISLLPSVEGSATSSLLFSSRGSCSPTVLLWNEFFQQALQAAAMWQAPSLAQKTKGWVL